MLNCEDTCSMLRSYTLPIGHTAFDDPRLIADAGLLLPATLARRLGLAGLLDQHVDLGRAAGRAHVADKGLTLIMSALAGGDSIDDVDALRAGATAAVLGQRVAAPSTVGTFLRSFSWGHARQLDVVSGALLRRAWAAGAGPGHQPLTIDIDSTICETYGLHKHGGRAFTHTGVRGYHPLLAVRAGSDEVLHGRLRGGNANTLRGAESFTTETITRVRRAGATGQITLRADSGFYAHGVVDACRRGDVRFSITARNLAPVRAAMGSIPEADWIPIPYWLDGGADVAETTYTPFRHRPGARPLRLIVRRVRPTPSSQLDLFGLTYTYHPFITDRDGSTLVLEADQCRHAEVENAIRDLKSGVGLNHLPSGQFGANAAWLGFQVMAHNLARWLAQLGLDLVATTKTLRRRLFAIAGRITRSARRLTLHLPARWPWQLEFDRVLARLNAIPRLV
jgi:hypothetical protein